MFLQCRLHLLLFALIITWAGTSVVGAADCVTGECHASMGTKQFVHGPVGANICTICHNPVSGKDHEFVFAAEKEELCLGCHETSRDMLLEDNVHTPVAEGNCIGCHDPHQSDYRYTLKGQAADLCFKCHNDEAFSREFIHGPVGAGDCNACHNPHASSNEKQLLMSPDELCYGCHTEQAGIKSKRHIHAPVDQACTNCHNPHSNKEKFLLGASGPDLCYGCHENIALYANAAHKHEPVATGQCDACHDVHASDNPNMFPLPQEQMCLSCHDDLAEYVAGQSHKHGPVKDGDCNACHDPHGSEFYRVLRQDFPAEFYKPYATENYALCFECHNKDIALNEKTKTLTDFRDGEKNMHFLHVNKDVKGRSCKACHQVHASSQGKHIRESVPFGNVNWELPVSYTMYENGGKCVVGCHAPKEYFRK